MFRRVIPLYIHIAYLFLGLILVFAVASLVHQYIQTKQLLMRDAEVRFSLIGQLTIQKLEGLFQPAALSTELLARHRLIEATTLEARLATVPYMVTLLQGQASANGVYAGYDNGDLFWLHPWPADTRVSQLTPPIRTRWILESIMHQGSRTTSDTFFLADDLAIIQRDSRAGLTLDARTRPWFKLARHAGHLVQTPPYISRNTQEINLSVAKPMSNGAGVVGIDLSLGSIERMLKAAALTPNMRLAIFNERDELITSHKGGQFISDREGNKRLAKVAETDLPMIQQLMQISKMQHSESLTFQSEGQNWQGMRVSLPAADGASLSLWMAVPHSELLATAITIRNQGFVLSLVFLGLAIISAVFLARTAARPLDALTLEARKIAQFDFNQPVQINTYIAEIIDLSQAMGNMKATIARFLQLSHALSSETSFQQLLARVLLEMQQVTHAHGSMIHLADGQAKSLQLARLRWGDLLLEAHQTAPLLLADQPHHPLTMSLNNPDQPPEKLTAAELQALFPLPADLTHALTLWAIPLTSREGKLLGTLTLLIDERQHPLSPQLMAFVQALSSTAAIALNTQRLLDEQKSLLESFIQLIAGAIDAKSPYTGGHCQRVPELTKMLAQAACDATEGPLRHFQLGDDQWEALHIAAWLHDCGKVVTPEFVVDKATKLETLYDRIHEIRMRFEVLKRDAEIHYWQSLASGDNAAELLAGLHTELQQLDEEFAFVARCNEGSEFMAPEHVERIHQLARRTWRRTLSDRVGISQDEMARKQHQPEPSLPTLEPLLADRGDHLFPRSERERLAEDNPWGFKVQVPEYLYNRGEIYNLCISRGTLADEERYKINEHMIQTIMMLEKLPFPPHLQSVPEMAGGHHEKMDGSGYPKRLTRDEMSIPARIMAIADIFEALTAGDRPYKKAKSLSEAIHIMGFMKKDQHIDPELFDLFLRSGIYRQYAERYMAPELVDEVDISPYLS